MDGKRKQNPTRAYINEKLGIDYNWSKSEKIEHINSTFNTWNSRLPVLTDYEDIEEAEEIIWLCAKAKLLYDPQPKRKKLKAPKKSKVLTPAPPPKIIKLDWQEPKAQKKPTDNYNSVNVLIAILVIIAVFVFVFSDNDSYETPDPKPKVEQKLSPPLKIQEPKVLKKPKAPNKPEVPKKHKVLKKPAAFNEPCDNFEDFDSDTPANIHQSSISEIKKIKHRIPIVSKNQNNQVYHKKEVYHAYLSINKKLPAQFTGTNGILNYPKTEINVRFYINENGEPLNIMISSLKELEDKMIYSLRELETINNVEKLVQNLQFDITDGVQELIQSLKFDPAKKNNNAVRTCATLQISIIKTN